MRHSSKRAEVRHGTNSLFSVVEVSIKYVSQIFRGFYLVEMGILKCSRSSVTMFRDMGFSSSKNTKNCPLCTTVQLSLPYF